MNGKFGKICPSCFSETYRDGKCEACGFDVKNARSNVDAINEFTVLRSRYLTGCIIGAGGFGITYKAYDIMSNRIVAVKEYLPHGVARRADDRVTLAEVSEKKYDLFVHGKRRFFEEAKALYACADIPAVVRILDYFQENNTAYFIMEYLNGITLRKYVNQNGRKLPYRDALEIICTVGDTLEQVHEQTGLFHRDISPENIIMTVDGKVKIIDFGSAKTLGKENLSIMLKPGFAPPEQYSSQSKQGRYTDVYALASNFYYLVTGSMVPAAPDRLQGVDYPRLKDMGLGVDESVSDTVDKALELKYQNRYQTVGEFISALRHTIKVDIDRKPLKDENGEIAGGVKVPSEENGVSREQYTHHPYLEVLTGDKKGIRWDLPLDQEITVGRSSLKSDIVVSDSIEISRPHLLLKYDSSKGSFLVKDVSSNGSYVGGYELERDKYYVLSDGCVVMLGLNVCTFKVGVIYDR